MSDLAAFLRARLDEDEAVARAAIQGPWLMGADQGLMHWLGSDGAKQPPERVLFGRSPIRSDARVQVADLSAAWNHTENGRHIARWDPVRVLAEVEAKRRIVEMAERTHRESDDYPGWEGAVLHLAQPYADHPDFDPAWRPVIVP